MQQPRSNVLIIMERKADKEYNKRRKKLCSSSAAIHSKKDKDKYHEKDKEERSPFHKEGLAQYKAITAAEALLRECSQLVTLATNSNMTVNEAAIKSFLMKINARRGPDHIKIYAANHRGFTMKTDDGSQMTAES